VDACQGYDLPPFVKFNDIKTWDEQPPPKGILSHYPNKGDHEVIVPGAAGDRLANLCPGHYAEDDLAHFPGQAPPPRRSNGRPGKSRCLTRN
jgi:hypothetical protein